MTHLLHSFVAACLVLSPLTAADALLPLRTLTEEGPQPAFEIISNDQKSNQTELFIQSIDYEGKPSKIFSILGVPESPTPLPAIVLIHGGGGTAFSEWVEKWNDHGFAAISIAVEGQTNEIAKDGEPSVGRWKRHAHPGPARTGIFRDSDRPLQDQWMFHAVAAGIQANNLLRNDPRIDPSKIGVMGISWGGIITSTLIGIDSRFCFAAPTYGCGSLAQVPNQYGVALSENPVYRDIWDASLRMNTVTIPTLWYSWTGDTHFPMAQFSDTYRRTSGPRQISIVPDMGHSHHAAWRRPESYDFARSVIASGKPWGTQKSFHKKGSQYQIQFSISAEPKGATLYTTDDEGHSAKANWKALPLTIAMQDGLATVAAEPPPSSVAWFVTLDFDDRYLSSEYVTRE